MDDQTQYRLTLLSGGRMVMEGTWFDAAVADRKFRSWIGDYSGLKDTRIVLEEQVGPAGEWLVVKTWPQETGAQ
ncbi:hypothetical protein [Streptomyces sp. NPDC056723]|uniref:hypothetical protein n=1 Tax=unclassified Streptomyces TaxID=2593676 RepID=UPI00368F35EC